MKKTVILSLTILLIASAVLTGCSSGAEKSGQILNLNITGEPTSLDPAQAFDEDSMDIANNLFVGLMRLDDHHQPQPALAEKVDISKDGLTYTFHLKQTKWSDGQPLTAHDFEYAWKRVLNPETAAKPAFLLYFIKGAEAYNQGNGSADQVGIKATDDYTLQVELAKPAPAFLELVAYPVYAPVSRQALENDPDMFHDAKNYVSNGAFQLAEWKHDNYVKLTKMIIFTKKIR